MSTHNTTPVSPDGCADDAVPQNIRTVEYGTLHGNAEFTLRFTVTSAECEAALREALGGIEDVVVNIKFL